MTAQMFLDLLSFGVFPNSEKCTGKLKDFAVYFEKFAVKKVEIYKELKKMAEDEKANSRAD